MITSYSELSICRVCEKENDTLFNIYHIGNIHIFNNLQELTCRLIEDEEITKLPKFICESCNSKLNEALEFKKQCLETETRFKVKIEKELEELKYEIEFLEEELDEIKDKIKKPDEHVFQKVEDEKKITKKNKKEIVVDLIPRLIQCPRCKSLFNNLQESIFHHRNKCKEIFLCKECPKIFTNRDAYDRHCKFTHPVNNPYECKLCLKIYKTTTSLRLHHRYIHLKERKQFCDICGKGFIDITGLRVHKESHKPKGEARLFKPRKVTKKTNEVPRICEKCGLQFPNYHTHYAHLKTKHPEATNMASTPSILVLKCPECKVTCSSQAGLRIHSRVHTDERPFQCTQCSSAFKIKNHLKAHIKAVHLGEKFYKCPICDKGLNDKGNYDVHLRKHEGIKPFACNYCPDTFYGPRLLKKHVAKHHPEEKGENL